MCKMCKGQDYAMQWLGLFLIFQLGSRDIGRIGDGDGDWGLGIGIGDGD